MESSRVSHLDGDIGGAGDENAGRRLDQRHFQEVPRLLQRLFCLSLGCHVALDGQKAGDIALLILKRIDCFLDGDETAVFGFVDDFTAE